MNTFNFGSGTLGSTGTSSTAGSTPPFNFGAPKTGTQTSAITSFTMPTTSSSPSTTGFGFPKQGATSPTAPNNFNFANQGGNASQQNSAKPPTFGFTVPSNLTTSGALPKSNAPSAFTMGTSSTSGTTQAPTFGTSNTTPTLNFGSTTPTTSQATTSSGAPISFGVQGGNKAPTISTGGTNGATTPNFSFGTKATTNGTTVTPANTASTQLNFQIPSGTSTTAPTLNLGTSTTTTTTPTLNLGTSASTVSTSTTTATTTSTSTVPTVSSADVQAILKGKSLDSILNSWGNEINTQTDAFMQQAHKIAEWDTELLKNKDKLTRLKDHLDSTSFAQDNLDRKLELIKEKQNDVNSVLKELEDGLEKMQTEQNVIDISKADKDRKKGYKLAEDINSQIDVIQGTLEELVTTLNEKRAVTSGQEEKPEAKIMAILNDHLITLQWIDQATLDLDLKVKEIEKSYKTYL